MSTETKYCIYCNTTKPIEEFGFFKHGKTGKTMHRDSCKPCHRADKEHLAYWDKQAIKYLKSVGAWPAE